MASLLATTSRCQIVVWCVGVFAKGTAHPDGVRESLFLPSYDAFRSCDAAHNLGSDCFLKSRLEGSRMNRLNQHQLYIGLTCSILSVLSGCGSGAGDVKPIANLAPCQGTVTFDGELLEQGTVGFVPLDQKTGQSATGRIRDGRFTMTTTVSAPGVVIGKYRVRVESFEQAEPDVSLEKPKGPPVMPPAPKSLIPTTYNRPETSGLEIEVTKGMASVELELKSK